MIDFNLNIKYDNELNIFIVSDNNPPAIGPQRGKIYMDKADTLDMGISAIGKKIKEFWEYKKSPQRQLEAKWEGEK